MVFFLHTSAETDRVRALLAAGVRHAEIAAGASITTEKAPDVIERPSSISA
jgi:hypothetical protein